MNVEVVYARKRCVRDNRKTPTVTITQIATTVSIAVSLISGHLPLIAQLSTANSTFVPTNMSAKTTKCAGIQMRNIEKLTSRPVCLFTAKTTELLLGGLLLIQRTQIPLRETKRTQRLKILRRTEGIARVD